MTHEPLEQIPRPTHGPQTMCDVPPGFISIIREDDTKYSYVRASDIIAVHPWHDGASLMLASHKHIVTKHSLASVLQAITNAEATQRGYLA